MNILRLNRIEVENFKSYKGRKVFDFITGFSAVVGSNGHGKSNIMDAICFVMGESVQWLRVNKLSDLIHGAVIGKPISRSASVTAVFTEEEYEITYQRSVLESSSEYKIDGIIVSYKEYLSSLLELKINIKAKNFLLFQGDVESLAMKHPKEMTQLFEDISGSGSLKAEYNRLYSEVQKGQKDIKCINDKLKIINAEKGLTKLSIREDDGRETNLDERLREYYLFKLFHNLRGTQILEADLDGEDQRVFEAERELENLKNNLKKKKKKKGKYNRELEKIEQDIRQVDVEIFNEQPEFLEAKESVLHVQKKLESAVKILDKARKAHQAHLNDIQKQEDDLVGAEREKQDYESKISGLSQSLGRDIHLEDTQFQEYNRLKKEAARHSTTYMHMQALDSLVREQAADHDRLDNIRWAMEAADDNRKLKLCEKKELETRVEKLTEEIRSTKRTLQQEKQLMEVLKSDVTSSRTHVEEIQKQLEDVVKQLGDAKTDKHQIERLAKKQQVMDHFKRNYSGVYDRIVNMVRPVHKRYNVAITKSLGSSMDAIVVDTEHTARLCIKYLREQHLDPETFLPLNSIKTDPINERLLRDIQGATLIIRVLKFEPIITNAVRFATKNAVVCETPEDASRVAFKLGTRLNAVALDGTYYRKSGIISGGSSDLARKAKRWEEKDILLLKSQKEDLTKELRQSTKVLRKESELNTVQSQVHGLETRLRDISTNLKSTEEQIVTIEKELTRLSAECEKYRPQIESIKESMKNRKKRIEDMQLKVNSVEDEVFSNFCRELQIRNIRQYEDEMLQVPEKRIKKRLSFDAQIKRISSLLDFERNRDTQSKVSHWEKIVHDEESLLEEHKKDEQKKKDKIDGYLRQLEQLKTDFLSKEREVKASMLEVCIAQGKVEVADKKLHAAMKSATLLRSQIEGKMSERHMILMQCMIDNVQITLTGRVQHIRDILTPDLSQASDSNSEISVTDKQYEREKQLQIDFSCLPQKMRNLKKEDHIKTVGYQLMTEIESLQNTVATKNTTVRRTDKNLKEIIKRENLIKVQLENARRDGQRANEAFELIKQKRLKCFSECFDKISNEIDGIYKDLTEDPSAQANLWVENAEEPYLGGINYGCAVPGKRFHTIPNLSGGEKTVVTLALLFAMHTFQPSPFLILDEVDAALDNNCVRKLTRYIRRKRESTQIMLITHKMELITHSDFLIGICPDLTVKVGDCLSSEIITLNLEQYEIM